MYVTGIRLLTLLYHLKYVFRIVDIPTENSPQRIGSIYTGASVPLTVGLECITTSLWTPESPASLLLFKILRTGNSPWLNQKVYISPSVFYLFTHRKFTFIYALKQTVFTSYFVFKPKSKKLLLSVTVRSLGCSEGSRDTPIQNAATKLSSVGCVGSWHQQTFIFSALCSSILVVTDTKLMHKCKRLSHSGSVRTAHSSVLKAYILLVTCCDKCMNPQDDYMEK